MGRDSSVDIATRYGLDCQGIESRWGRDFPRPSSPALGPTQPPIQWVPGLFPVVNRWGRGVNHQLPSSAEVKVRVELYLRSRSGPSWPVLGRTLLYLIFKNAARYQAWLLISGGGCSSQRSVQGVDLERTSCRTIKKKRNFRIGDCWPVPVQYKGKGIAVTMVWRLRGRRQD